MKPYYQDDAVTIYHGDCRSLLPMLTADDVVMITDPPYGTGGWRRTESGRGQSPKASLVREGWDAGDVDWLTPIPTLTFWTAERTLLLLSKASSIGLTKHRALYMQKPDPKPQVAGRIRWSVEPIWCLSPSGFTLYGGTDWINASTPRFGRDADATEHPYEKPLSVMYWLVSKTRAETILDPFMGSGTTLRAAKDAGRTAVGIEIEEEYCEIAAKRLRKPARPVLFARRRTQRRARRGTGDLFK